jgi:hypothetical protein
MGAGMRGTLVGPMLLVSTVWLTMAIGYAVSDAWENDAWLTGTLFLCLLLVIVQPRRGVPTPTWQLAPRPSLASRCKPIRQIRYSRAERIRGLFFLSTSRACSARGPAAAAARGWLLGIAPTPPSRTISGLIREAESGQPQHSGDPVLRPAPSLRGWHVHKSIGTLPHWI